MKQKKFTRGEATKSGIISGIIGGIAVYLVTLLNYSLSGFPEMGKIFAPLFGLLGFTVVFIIIRQTMINAEEEV